MASSVARARFISDGTSEELQPLLQSEDEDSESDSGVESLVDLEINSSTNSISEPTSVPPYVPLVPFHPPLHRWVSQETLEPAKPNIPSASPFIPTLHQNQTSDQTEHDDDDIFPIDVVCRSITPPSSDIQPGDTAVPCEICYKLITEQLPCCSAHICHLCIRSYAGYCLKCSYSANEDTRAQPTSTRLGDSYKFLDKFYIRANECASLRSFSTTAPVGFAGNSKAC